MAKPERKLRIAMSVANLKGQSTYTRAYFLARELVRRGHEVTVFCLSSSSRFKIRHSVVDGVPVVEFPNFLTRPIVLWGLGPLDILYRTAMLLKERFDIVHGFEYFPDVVWPIIITHRLKGYVFVSDWADWFSKGIELRRPGRHDWPARLIGHFEDTTRRRADAVTTISTRLKQRAAGLGIAPDRLLHMTNGAPSDLILPIPKNEARAKLGIDPNAKIIGYLGGHTPDLDLLIEPMVRLSQSMPQLRLMLIGNLEAHMYARFRQRGLEEKLIVPGWVPWEHMSLHLAAADVFVLTMRKNTYNEYRCPGKIGDYMAAGRPLLASDVGEVRHIVREGGFGFCWDNSTTDFIDKLMLILNEPRLADEMGCRARQMAEGVYSWRVRGVQMETFYRRLVS